MNTPKNRCQTCGHIIDDREICLYSGLVKALWEIFKLCKTKNRHEFKMKEIRHLLGRNEYARFGDWVLFGGLVYKLEKASYGLNMERCNEFFANRLKIPTTQWKNGITGELTIKEYGYARDIRGLIQLLDSEKMYIANYKPTLF